MKYFWILVTRSRSGWQYAGSAGRPFRERLHVRGVVARWQLDVFHSNPGGVNHIWRQRFPDGQPERITSAPTEEEGMAMVPDGRSFVTAVALQSTSLWVHDAKGDRQISLEGNAVKPQFTPDGKKLCYLIVREAPNEFAHPGELRIADLESGRSGPVMHGLPVLDYDKLVA